jgi:hypothetical protein
VWTNHEPFLAKGFRVKMIIREQIESRQRRIANRLDKVNYPVDMSKPMMRGSNIQFELSDRTVGTAYGGIGLIHQFGDRTPQPALTPRLVWSCFDATIYSRGAIMAGSSDVRVADEWRGRFARYAMSELTVVEFCIVEGVSASSFYLWRKKLAKKSEHREDATIHRSVFAPVRLVTSPSVPAPLVAVQLPGGTRLEIPMSDCDAFERTIRTSERTWGT